MLAIDDIVDAVRQREGWSSAEARAHAAAYLAFLLGKGQRSRRPTRGADAIWHAHILHTRRYREDCEALVGHFVDHEPFGAPERGAGSAGQPAPAAQGFDGSSLAECGSPAGPPDASGLAWAAADCAQPSPLPEPPVHHGRWKEPAPGPA
jgi:hypothetical protein